MMRLPMRLTGLAATTARLAAVALACLICVTAWADEATFKTDLDALTRHAHRHAGTPEARAAADHVEARLRAIPGVEVFPLDMPIWATHVERCDLTVAGRTVQLQPLRPNLIVHPVTEHEEGLTTASIYVGQGRPEDYGDRQAHGKIVVFEYDSHDHWERAFALGAAAVIFIGGDATPLAPKHTGVPANYPRFHATPDLLDAIDLRRDHDEVTLVSRVHWKPAQGRNVLALIPGTQPDFIESRKEPEMIVLAAALDTLGVVTGNAPGARGAANVAALLQTVEHLAANRPRRDVLVMFLDNEARFHQGARYSYDTLTLKPADLAQQAKMHQDEHLFRTAMRQMILPPERFSDESDPSIRDATFNFLYNLSSALHSDLKQEQMRRRIAREAARGKDQALNDALLAEILAGDHEILQWDNMRRVLHYRTLDELRELMRRIASLTPGLPQDELDNLARRVRRLGIREGFAGLSEDGQLDTAIAEARAYTSAIDSLLATAADRLAARLVELDELIAQDAQRQAINERVSDRWVVLHADFNFSDIGPVWGVVVGNRITALYPFKNFGASSDTPGYYGRVLGAFREAATVLPADSGIYADTLRDTSLGGQFAPGVFATSGYVAGTFGLYNVTLMTGYDARLRDGHPADTLDALNWRSIHAQSGHASALLRALSDGRDISLPRQFSDQSRSKRVGWAGERPTGDYAALRVTGSLSEDRPAFGAVMAMWPGKPAAAQIWTTFDQMALLPSFDPVMLERVDINGRFRIIGVQREIFSHPCTLGGMFDELGRVTAITTQRTLTRGLAAAARVELFLGDGHSLAAMPGQRATPDAFKVLRAASDSALPPTRSLVGQHRNFSFFYISRQDINVGVDRIKIFQPEGPVVVNATRSQPAGMGVTLGELEDRPPLAEPTAGDLWAINEMRLNMLRTRGVTSEDLELLHSRARRAMELAAADEGDEALPASVRKARLVQSAALSQAVYRPLRQSMDDLVHAIVVLLLLAIPFAFAVERLLFCATTIYGRLLGFTAAFLVTFGLLYTMHPGFAIASTPIIIFLAFAILLLSILVIHIIVRKFRTELKAMQGQRVGLHDVEVSRMGTLLAAVSMGMSTMRRRPTRTFLTAITVIMLTFTILSFASFTRKIGVRAIYEGPIGEEAAGEVLVRKLDYSAMAHHALDLVRGLEGRNGAVFGQYWLVRRGANDLPYSVARATAVTQAEDRVAMSLDAVLGVTPEELDRWPLMLAALRGGGDDAASLDALRRGGVFLPSVVVERLGLKINDPVLLNGTLTFVAGTFDSAALQRLKHLDGQSILPVNFQDPSAQQQQTATTDDTSSDLVDKDFVHLSADQVAIASSAFVKQQGGGLHAMVVYFAEGIDPLARAEEIARIVPMPLWARGSQGVERMILTTLTEVSGGLALAVPVILGGLIIFGTLLGSITDREKEIYTFSALGLAPGHVGVLFFAEAAVYAIVGGMGGQLLAQIVAQISSYLAQIGLISPPQVNYSSTNSLFAIGIVMATVIISAIYPAIRASRSANPGLARAWKMPPPVGDQLEMTFPFTVSAYDITGVVSFLAEHFERHDDAGLGSFAAQNVRIGKTGAEGNLFLSADVALAPFDLGVTQGFTLTARPSEIAGVDEVGISATRHSGANGDWLRANRVFLRDLRKQFLLWRTLSGEMIENYRMNTLSRLGGDGAMTTHTPQPTDPS
jgi:hypothetical protein